MSGHGTSVATAFFNTSDDCESRLRLPYQVPWAIFTGVACGMNVFLLVAMAKSWGILRQNVTHYHIVGCLLSSIVLCGLSVYETIHAIHEFDISHLKNGSLRYNPTNTEHNSIMNRFAYRRGLIVALFIIMQLNIVSLIYGVSNNAYFVGRYSDPKPLPKTQFDIPVFKNNDKQRKRLSLEAHAIRWKRYKTLFSIFLSWVLPLLLTIPLPLGWNCVKYCSCLPMIRNEPYCSAEVFPACSRFWHPMSGSYVLAAGGIWFAGMILVFGLLISTILKFYRTHSSRQPIPAYEKPERTTSSSTLKWTKRNKNKATGGPRGAVTSTAKNATVTGRSRSYHGYSSHKVSAATRPTSSGIRIGSLYTAKLESEKECASAHNTKPVMRESRSFSVISTAHNRKPTRPPLDPTVRMLIAVSLSSFLCVCPIMTVLLLDSLSAASLGSLPFNIALTVSLLHTAALPIMLVKYMNGVRKAVNNLIMVCPCLRTTVIVKAKQSTNDKSPRSRIVEPSSSTMTNRTFQEENHGVVEVIVISDASPDAVVVLEGAIAQELPSNDENDTNDVSNNNSEHTADGLQSGSQEKDSAFAEDTVGGIFNTLSLSRDA